jgi:chromosome partitioning protein
MDTQVICIASCKGGTGKTTTVLNVGMLMGKAGYSVLLVDLDPQCSLTLSLLPEQPQESIYDAFLSPIRDWSRCVMEVGENVCLMPCSPEASQLESVLASRTQREETLVRILRKMNATQKYDIILLDCPPSLNMLTACAMAASDNLYVSTVAEVLPIRSLPILESMAEDVRDRLNPSLNISGIIITRYNESRNLNRLGLETLREHYPDMVFKSVIRENVKIAEAPQRKQCIADYAPFSNGTKDYVSLTNEIILRLENENF